MADREKVIYSIERCICHVPDACRDCAYDAGHPYNECVEMMLKDTLSLLKAQESGWISVKDRLPNDYQPVIVSDGEEPEFAIFYDHYNGYGPTFVTPDCYEEERIEGITHWMPLPEPPKEG